MGGRLCCRLVLGAGYAHTAEGNHTYQHQSCHLYGKHFCKHPVVPVVSTTFEACSIVIAGAIRECIQQVFRLLDYLEVQVLMPP